MICDSWTIRTEISHHTVLVQLYGRSGGLKFGNGSNLVIFYFQLGFSTKTCTKHLLPAELTEYFPHQGPLLVFSEYAWLHVLVPYQAECREAVHAHVLHTPVVLSCCHQDRYYLRIWRWWRRLWGRFTPGTVPLPVRSSLSLSLHPGSCLFPAGVLVRALGLVFATFCVLFPLR